MRWICENNLNFDKNNFTLLKVCENNFNFDKNNFTLLKVLPFILILRRECQTTETKNTADVLLLDLQSNIRSRVNNTLAMTMIDSAGTYCFRTSVMRTLLHMSLCLPRTLIT
jgi:hypothetical protein